MFLEMLGSALRGAFPTRSASADEGDDAGSQDTSGGADGGDARHSRRRT